MELNEIKKMLYKQKPLAKIEFVKDGKIHYRADIAGRVVVLFEVPISDIGDATFHYGMDAQLLIRYISFFDRTQ